MTTTCDLVCGKRGIETRALWQCAPSQRGSRPSMLHAQNAPQVNKKHMSFPQILMCAALILQAGQLCDFPFTLLEPRYNLI